MKKIIPRTKEEWANIVIAVVGIVMIVVSVLLDKNPAVSTSGKILAIVGDLGIGILPAGVIGVFLERIQSREKEAEKSKKRTSILNRIELSIHDYLNIICNSIIAARAEYQEKQIFDMIWDAYDADILVPNFKDGKKKLRSLVEAIEESFNTLESIYIATDIFTEDEEKHFTLLIKKGYELLSLLTDGSNALECMQVFLSYLEIACKEIPEFQKFLKMKSNGDNISIPI